MRAHVPLQLIGACELLVAAFEITHKRLKTGVLTVNNDLFSKKKHFLNPTASARANDSFYHKSCHTCHRYD